MARPSPDFELTYLSAMWVDGFGSVYPFGPSYAHPWERVYTGSNSSPWPPVKGVPLPWNNFDVSIYRTTSAYSRFSARWQQYPGNIWHGSGDTFPWNNYDQSPYYSFIGDPALASDAANMTARRMAKNSAGQWGVNLAEWRQTGDMALKAAGRMIDLLKNLRRGNFSKFKPSRSTQREIHSLLRGKVPPTNPVFVQALHNGVLETQYGWRPLYSDVYDAFNHASRGLDKTHVCSVLGKATRTFTQMGPSNVDIGALLLSWERTATHHSHTFLEFSVSDAARDQIKSYGLSNPASLAWELVPFSFVADWFLPVGAALDALDAFDGLSFHRGLKVNIYKQKSKLTFARNPSYNFNGTNGYLSLSASDETKEWVRVQRVVFDTFPSVSLPHFKNPLSSEHLLNALALIGSAMGRHKPIDQHFKPVEVHRLT